MYPHNNDWDYIARLTGDESWAAKNMRQYFERLESCKYMPRNTPGHGITGWLETTHADVKLALGDIKVLSILKGAASVMDDSVVEGLEDLVEILSRDHNCCTPLRDSTEVISQLPLSISGGKRSGARDFVVATADAKNADGSKKYALDIRTACLATRILFEREQNPPKAVGVEFLDGNSLYRADPRSGTSGTRRKGRVMVSREVILSAGAFNTPQLLKLSGLGPKDELDEFQIPLLAELPGVGENLQDRYEVCIISKLEGDFQAVAKCTFGKPGDPCLQEYHDGRGPYLSNGLTFGIVKKSSVAELDPDLFIFGGPVYFRGYYPGYSERTVTDKQHFSWAVLKAHTRNRHGRVKLRSADPLDAPEIDFNYFDTGTTEHDADQLDLRAIAEGVQFARRIMDDLPSAAGDVEEEVPGRAVASADEINDFIKNEAFGHHASCTCPIGPNDDPNAVLDSRFRVRGVKNLRVVDASVFPRIPGTFLILPIYMISEKAADVILEDL
jgi:choline dehydrogenase